jgi:hypothetical protein
MNTSSRSALVCIAVARLLGVTCEAAAVAAANLASRSLTALLKTPATLLASALAYLISSSLIVHLFTPKTSSLNSFKFIRLLGSIENKPLGPVKIRATAGDVGRIAERYDGLDA